MRVGSGLPRAANEAARNIGLPNRVTATMRFWSNSGSESMMTWAPWEYPARISFDRLHRLALSTRDATPASTDCTYQRLSKSGPFTFRPGKP